MTFARPASTARRAHLPRGWALVWLLALLLAQQVLLLHPLSHLPALPGSPSLPAGSAPLALAGEGPGQADPADSPGSGDRADAACLVCLAAAGLSAAPPPTVATLSPPMPAAMGRPPTDAPPATAAARRFRLARGPPPPLQRA